MLHIHPGDCSADMLRRSGVPGEVMTWCDVLHGGPVPAGAGGLALRRLRAQYLSGTTRGVLTSDGCLRHLTKQDEALARFAAHDEVVLWFDACLYDQLILIRQLDWFARQDRGSTRLSLICVGEFPGFPRFKGLGELNPGQLASPLDQRHAVTPAEFALARAAWAAFRAPDPTPVEHLAGDDTSALPYLGAALRRLLQEFPSVQNGLGRLEQGALDTVAAGCGKLPAIFAAVSDREERPFFGDTTLWGCLDGLATGAHPLIASDGPGPLPLWDPPKRLDAWSLRATPAGLDVLANRQDHVALNGIDRWLGGVHLQQDGLWRWDTQSCRLVRGRA